jgi:hypothetical protein
MRKRRVPGALAAEQGEDANASINESFLHQPCTPPARDIPTVSTDQLFLARRNGESVWGATRPAQVAYFTPPRIECRVRYDVTEAVNLILIRVEHDQT